MEPEGKELTYSEVDDGYVKYSVKVCVYFDSMTVFAGAEDWVCEGERKERQIRMKVYVTIPKTIKRD